jgi:hypothetical protein
VPRTEIGGQQGVVVKQRHSRFRAPRRSRRRGCC